MKYEVNVHLKRVRNAENLLSFSRIQHHIAKLRITASKITFLFYFVLKAWSFFFISAISTLTFLPAMFLSFYMVLYFPLWLPLPSNLSFIQTAWTIQPLYSNPPVCKSNSAGLESRSNYAKSPPPPPFKPLHLTRSLARNTRACCAEHAICRVPIVGGGGGGGPWKLSMEDMVFQF